MAAEPSLAFLTQMTAAGRQFSTDELVRNCLAVAIRRGQEAGLSRDNLHTALDVAILNMAPGLPGAIEALPAARAGLRGAGFTSIGEAAEKVVDRLRYVGGRKH